MKNAREYLIESYLDYVNNYLTLAKYGEHNGLTERQAVRFLDLAKTVYYSEHPES